MNHPPLLETKLCPPSSVRPAIDRPRLELPRELVDGTCTVASIVAPAGYGKSTLMARWHATWPDASCAWLALDEHDNAPRRLLRYLIGGLRGADPSLGGDALAELAGDGFVLHATALESLAIDLAREHRRLVLFIDDLHMLTADRAIGTIDWLVRFAPRSVQFVIGSREAPRVHLASLRARGHLLEIGQRQLAFDRAEIELMCRQRAADAVDPFVIDRLAEKTEGWPAAVELALVALRGEHHPHAFIDDMARSDRNIVEYLRDSVCHRLDAASRGLLHQIAQFDRVNAPLAGAATGSVEAETLLTSAHAQNVFLVALDRRGDWYRFHHLVGDYWRSAGSHAAARSALTAGGGWLYDHDYREEAIQCAIRAHAWEAASTWMAAAIEDAAQRYGMHELVLHWVKRVPRKWIDRHPVIGLNYAYSLAFFARDDELDAQMARLESTLDAMVRDPQADVRRTETLRCSLEMQRIVNAALRDAGSATHAAAATWLRHWPDAPLRLRGDALNSLAWGCKSIGEIDSGLAAARRARDTLASDGSYHGLVWNAIIVALLELKRGDYAAAREQAERGLGIVVDRLQGHRECVSFLHALLAAVAYEFDDLEAAERHIEHATPHIDDNAPADILILAYLTEARLQFARGNASGGFSALEAGARNGKRRRLRRVEISLAAEQCVWLSRNAEYKTAAALAARCGFDREAHAEYDMIAERASRVAPRLALVDASQVAVAQLAAPLARSAAKGFHHRRAQLLILQAAALVRAARTDDALAAWNEAIALGNRYGYRRLFLDDAEITHALTTLGRGRRDAVVMPAWLVPNSGKDAARPSLPSHESLTHKELRILRALASGLRNREIAASMFISEGTLKWHLHNVYRKLDCRNRSGAVAIARKLGIA